MRFDDEQIVETVEYNYHSSEIANKAGKTQLTVFANPEAPLVKTRWKVLLELRESGDHKKYRPGVDLVTVIDVSESMAGDKLDNLKNAMQFLVKKLSPIDRMSVVTFSRDAQRLFPLRQITECCQVDIEKQVNAFVANGSSTNIANGLETGLKVLNDRHFKDGRVGAVMLMSDGGQTVGDAAKVQFGDVQIHTFGFGADPESRVLLKAIADNGKGGTLSDVQNKNNLSIAFSQCLPGLLAMVQDLRLTVAPFKEELKIQHVSAGNYPHSRNNNSVTVLLGDLYSKEVRKVVVELLLPETKSPKSMEVLEVTYNHSGNVGKLYHANPIRTLVERKDYSPNAKMMKEAKVTGDEQMLEEAKKKVVEANNLLVVADIDEPNNRFFEMVTQQLYKRSADVQFGRSRFVGMRAQDMLYKKQGRSFLGMSCFETCHDRHLPLHAWKHTSSKPSNLIRIPPSLSVRSSNPLMTSTPLLAKIM